MSQNKDILNFTVFAILDSINLYKLSRYVGVFQDIGWALRRFVPFPHLCIVYTLHTRTQWHLCTHGNCHCILPTVHTLVVESISASVEVMQSHSQ